MAELEMALSGYQFANPSFPTEYEKCAFTLSQSGLKSGWVSTASVFFRVSLSVKCGVLKERDKIFHSRLEN